MGCCSTNNKYQLELPFEKLEEYDKLKLEIEKFLSSQNSNEKTDTNKVLDLLIKLTNQISKSENEVNKLKSDKTKSENINDDLIEGINQDIQILKDYKTKLNNLLKEKDNDVFNQEQKEIINEKEEIINNEEEEEQNSNVLKNKKDINNNNEIKEKEKENSSDIYFKKSIRRNKKGILNQKYYLNQNKMNNYKNETSFKNMDNIDTNDYLHLNTNDNINIIFEFDNGKKVGLKAMKYEKFMDIIEKLGEIDIGYDNLENLQFFDGKNNINEKILNGDKVGEFNLNDFHVIKVHFDK